MAGERVADILVALADDPATQFLQKPFTADQLLEVLSAAMGGASSITRRPVTAPAGGTG